MRPYRYVDEDGDELELEHMTDSLHDVLVTVTGEHGMVALGPQAAADVAQWLQDWLAQQGEAPALKLTGERVVDERDLVDEVALLRGAPRHDVYQRFIEEIDALVIRFDMPAVKVVGELTRAVRRAQMVIDGELRPVGER